MSDFFEVTIQDGEVQAMLNRLLQRTGDLSEPMADIARILANVTEDAFLDETSPFGAPWAPLARVTIEGRAARLARNTGGGVLKSGRISKGVGNRLANLRILQDTGQLAGSIAGTSGRDYAELTVGKVYAAIHQFGGEAGRGHTVTIPARPYLPVDDQGNLPDATQALILDEIADYLVG